MTKAWKEYNKIPAHKKQALKPLNELSGSEWAQLSKSVVEFNGTIARKRKEHGAAFPFSLARQIIRTYTIKGDTVLDPFVGVGTTTDAAYLLGREGIGFEINSKFYALSLSEVEEVDRSSDDVKNPVKPTIYNKPVSTLRALIQKESVDLTLTSPPYSRLLNITIDKFASSNYEKNIYKNSGRKLASPYSQNTEDLGNMTWDVYCRNIQKLMNDLMFVSKPGAFNVWVVRDFRDMEEGIPLVNLHGKIIELAETAGWILNDIVVWNQTNQRKLVKMGGIKSRRFYFNIGHSYILVFRKNVDGERFHNEH